MYSDFANAGPRTPHGEKGLGTQIPAGCGPNTALRFQPLCREKRCSGILPKYCRRVRIGGRFSAGSLLVRQSSPRCTYHPCAAADTPRRAGAGAVRMPVFRTPARISCFLYFRLSRAFSAVSHICRCFSQYPSARRRAPRQAPCCLLPPAGTWAGT